MMLKVLGRSTSINVRKVLWTCDELGLAFDNEAWGAGVLSTKSPEFLALNPNGLVPVLVDGDLVLWESNTICRYLAGREGRLDLLPAALAERAQVERWMDWQAGELNNAWRYAFLSLVRKNPPQPDPQRLATSVAEWNRHMQMLDDQLAKTGAYVAGSSFTLADIVLGLAAHRWRMTPIERAELPAVQAWLTRLDQRPALKVHGRSDTP